jgi:biopolymer transport protein ExbB
MLVLSLACAGCTFHAASARTSDAQVDTVTVGDSSDAPVDGNGSDWWDTDWLHRRQLTIDNSSIAETLSGFPVDVTLTTANFDYAFAQADGGDLRFVTDAGDLLPYDLDTWSPSATSSIWVGITIPPAPTGAVTAWLYYDNSTAPNGATPSQVWPTFTSVHHLGADFSDATGNGHDGTPPSPAATPSETAGEIGGARAFDGSNDSVDVASGSGSAYDFTTAMSASVWITVIAFDIEFECVVCKGDSSWRIHRGDTSSHADFGTTPAVGGTSDNDDLQSTSNVDGGGWHQVTVSFDGSNKSIFVDGGLQAMDVEGTLATTTFGVVIGENDEAVNPSLRNWGGNIDELRISGVARDAAWFAAEYRTVTDATFAQLGSDQALR